MMHLSDTFAHLLNRGFFVYGSLQRKRQPLALEQIICNRFLFGRVQLFARCCAPEQPTSHIVCPDRVDPVFHTIDFFHGQLCPLRNREQVSEEMLHVGMIFRWRRIFIRLLALKPLDTAQYRLQLIVLINCSYAERELG